MDVSTVLYVVALVLAVVSVVDGRPWLAAAVILVCIGLLLNSPDLR